MFSEKTRQHSNEVFLFRREFIMNLINRIGEELGFAFNFVKVGLLLTCFLVAIADLFM